MSFFAHSLPAPRPKNKYVQAAGVGLAGLIIVMVVAQLFTFEKFPDVVVAMALPYGDAFAQFRAASIVTLEVAALPFLLSMRLSRLARIISMIAGWMVIAAWTFVALWTYGFDVNSGFLGATIPLGSNWWVVMFCLGVAALAGWVAWGMWPGRTSKD
jgi:hypothetical protein